MECRDTKLLIEAYWDGHLPPETAAQVERHLRECSICRAEYGPVTQLLTGPEPVIASAGLRERICAAIETLPMPGSEPAGESRRLRRWQSILQAPWAGALAACVTFALLGWLSSQIPGGGPGPEVIRVTPVSAPNPMLALGWAQSIAIPGPCNSLAAMAQATALDSLVDQSAAEPAAVIHGRVRLSDLPATHSTPALSDLPLVAGTMYAGYPH
jgi:anti-sigma factor RsiW